MTSVEKSDFFERFANANDGNFESLLDEFLDTHKSTLTFESLAKSELRVSIWHTLLKYLEDPSNFLLDEKCLFALRILSRDKAGLDNLITKERFNVILRKANLKKLDDGQNISNTKTAVEAVKLINNLVFNSAVALSFMSDEQCLSRLTQLINTYDESISNELKIFSIRILFITSSLNDSSRKFLRNALKAEMSLTNILEEVSNCDDDELNKEKVELACEALNTLYTLLAKEDKRATDDYIGNYTDDEIQNYRNLVSSIRRLLLKKSAEKGSVLHSKIANLLIVVPDECYKYLYVPSNEKHQKHVYENMDMTAVSVLLKLLDEKLASKNNSVENLCPIIMALHHMSGGERLIRKYIKRQILPPLKDVMKRPEEGESTRAKLCQLLTSPVAEVRDPASVFLFVLCKENIDRMMKYTGYGNAAGIIAKMGLLNRKKPKTYSYSDSSDNSDTEEYTKYKEHINLVTGCYEGPKPDPLAGMTEEQKEYEAMKFVNFIDELKKKGIIQPCVMDEDGKPRPAEHILELQERLPNMQVTQQDSDSD